MIFSFNKTKKDFYQASVDCTLKKAVSWGVLFIFLLFIGLLLFDDYIYYSARYKVEASSESGAEDIVSGEELSKVFKTLEERKNNVAEILGK